MSNHADTGLTIRGFGEAAAQAFALHVQFDFCHAAACLDDDGRVLDLTAFTDAAIHSVDSALDWAFCVVANHARVRRVVMFSTGPEPVVQPSEADLALFRIMQAAFAGEGIVVIDWLRCDGENVRSLAFTHRSDAWGAA